jgi:hypothetical protein
MWTVVMTCWQCYYQTQNHTDMYILLRTLILQIFALGTTVEWKTNFYTEMNLNCYNKSQKLESECISFTVAMKYIPSICPIYTQVSIDLWR